MTILTIVTSVARLYCSVTSVVVWDLEGAARIVVG